MIIVASKHQGHCTYITWPLWPSLLHSGPSIAFEWSSKASIYIENVTVFQSRCGQGLDYLKALAVLYIRMGTISIQDEPCKENVLCKLTQKEECPVFSNNSSFFPRKFQDNYIFTCGSQSFLGELSYHQNHIHQVHNDWFMYLDWLRDSASCSWIISKGPTSFHCWINKFL